MEKIEEKLDRYKALTRAALEKATIRGEEGSMEYRIGADFREMAANYFSDARYFEKRGDLLTALAACSYAHAWLDAGIRGGFLDGKGDERLFTLR